MDNYDATFYSHFGALSYCKALRAQGIEAKLMPVPRALSAACGTCVRYANDAAVDADDCELEGVYLEEDGAFVCVIKK